MKIVKFEEIRGEIIKNIRRNMLIPVKVNKEAKNLSSNTATIINAFSVRGCAVIETWFQNGMLESPEEVAHLVDTLCHYGSRGLLKEYN